MIVIKGTRTINYEIPIYKYLDYFGLDADTKSIGKNLGFKRISEEELLNLSTFTIYENDIKIVDKNKKKGKK